MYVTVVRSLLHVLIYKKSINNNGTRMWHILPHDFHSSCSVPLYLTLLTLVVVCLYLAKSIEIRAAFEINGVQNIPYER